MPAKTRKESAEWPSAIQQVKHLNMVICRAADHGSVNGLLNIVAAKQAEMNCVNITTALHRLARLTKESMHAVNAQDPRFLSLRYCTIAELERQLTEMPQGEPFPQCWATMSWAYAILPARDAELVRMYKVICELATPHLDSFRPFELTNLLWGYAKVGVPCVKLFGTACDVVMSNVRSFPSPNLATLVWAFVTVQSRPAGMLRQIAEEFGRHLDTHVPKPIELANMLWGLASARLHIKKQCLHAVGCKARDLLPAFKVQELTIISWAFSRLDARHDEFFLAAARRLIDSECFRQCVHGQGAANILWAFERQQDLGSAASSELAQATLSMVPRCLQILPQLKAQEFTSILHAIMHTGLRWRQWQTADQLFTSAALLTPRLLEQLSRSQIQNLLESFAGFAPSGCGAPECCIALQNCLKAACRVKSLNSTKIQRHGSDGNLVQTSLSENRIQCEET